MPAHPPGQPSPPDGIIWLRPHRATTGRPPQHTRAEITTAAITIADRDGLTAVSMRRVAADLNTGAASLYRYLDTREDLLDLMTDATGAEYSLPPPSGDWLADLVVVGEQARAIMRHHRWLPTLVITRPTLGPNGIAVLEYVLGVLAGHPAPLAAKLEAFAMLNTITAVSVQYELAGGSVAQQRNQAYLQHVLVAGDHPHLAQLLGSAAAGPASPAEADPFPGILARVLTGLLGPTSAGS